MTSNNTTPHVDLILFFSKIFDFRQIDRGPSGGVRGIFFGVLGGFVRVYWSGSLGCFMRVWGQTENLPPNINIKLLPEKEGGRKVGRPRRHAFVLSSGRAAQCLMHNALVRC